MLSDCPDPKEVADFHFRQLRTINIRKENESIPLKSVNNLASASKYGLLFVGIEGGFKVIKLEDVLTLDEDRENRSVEKNYPYFLVPSGTPIILAVNASQTVLAVCVRSASSTLINLYSLSAISHSDAAWQPFCLNTLSSPAIELQDFSWNPTVEGLYAFCLSDGSLHIHEVAGTSIKSVASLQVGNAISVCWSPKGKQLVVGKRNGSFSQYKPTLQEVKTVVPPAFEESPVAVTSICWISNTVFAVVYVVADAPNLCIVSTPKDSAVVYTNFNDVCLGNNSAFYQKYFLHLEPSWGILICASLDSIEVAVLGDMPNWVQWDLREDGKALLPGKDGATHAVGMTVMYSAQKQITISENESYPPMPVMFLLTNNGLLVSFHMINTKPEASATTLVSPPLPFEMKMTENGCATADSMQTVKKLLPQSPSPLVTSPFASEKVTLSNQTSVLQKNNSENISITASSTVTKDLMFSRGDHLKESLNSLGKEIVMNKPEGVPLSSSLNTQEKSYGNMGTTFTAPGRQNEVQSSTDNSYMMAIVSEIQSFTKELEDLKQLQNSAPSIDNEEDMISLKIFALNLHNFQNDISQTMKSLSSDIYTLKNVLLESFQMVEEASSRERRKNDHSYITMLKDRALDPVTSKRMQKTTQHYQYVRTQLQEVNDKLDQDLIHHISNKEKSLRNNRCISSTEAIYKTIVTCQNIIHSFKLKVDELLEKMEEKKLRNTTKSSTWGKYHRRSTQEDLSKLADEFLQVKIAFQEEGEPTVGKKLSIESQNVLKAFLKESSVTTVRPTTVYSPSQSRLLSNAVLSEEFIPYDQEKDILPEQVSPPKGNSVANASASKPLGTDMTSNITFAKKISADESTIEPYAPVYEPVTPPEVVNTLQPISKTFTVCSTLVTPLSKDNSPDIHESFLGSTTENSSVSMQNDSTDRVHCSTTSTSTVNNKGLPTTAFTTGVKFPSSQVSSHITSSTSTTVIPPKSQLFTSPSEHVISRFNQPLETASTSASYCETKDPFYSSSTVLSASVPESNKSITGENSQIFHQVPVIPTCVTTSSSLSLGQGTSFNLPVSGNSQTPTFSFASTIIKHSAQTPPLLQKSFGNSDQSRLEGDETPRSLSFGSVNKDSVDSKLPNKQECGIDVPKTDGFISSNEAVPGIIKTDVTTNNSQANISIVPDSKQSDSPDTLVSKPSVIFCPAGNVTQQSVCVANVIIVSSTPSTTTAASFIPQVTSASKSTTSSVSSETTSASAISLFGQNVTICSPISSGASSDVAKKVELSTSSAFEAKSTLFGKPTPSETPSFFQTTTTTPDAPPSFVQTTSAQQTTSFGQSSTFPPASEGFFSQTPSFGTPTTTSATNSDSNSQASTFSFGKPAFGQTAGSFGLAKSFFGQQNAAPITQSGTASSFSFGQNSNLVFGQGSFFSGLGGKPSEENASKNVFGGISSSAKSIDSGNLFRNAATASFGAINSGNSFTGTGSFSSGGGSVAQSGFGAFQQSAAQQTVTGFGTAPAFGSAPTFGSAPAFGSSPTFGSGSTLSSVFGQQQQQQQQQQVSSNFSNFANASSPTFGSLASQTSSFSNPQLGSSFGSPPAFGSLSFGNQTSSFGNSGSPPSNSSAFTQWR